MTAVYLGDNNLNGVTSAAVTQTVTASSGTGTPDYSLTASPVILTVAAGSTASDTITFTPTGGFTGYVTLGCSGLPQYVSCSFNPTTLSADGSNTIRTSTLTVNTVQALEARGSRGGRRGLWLALAACTMPLGAFLLIKIGGKRRWLPVLLLLAVLALSLSACGGGGGSSSNSAGTTHKAAPGQYSVQVTAVASSGSVASRSLSLSIVVTQ